MLEQCVNLSSLVDLSSNGQLGYQTSPEWNSPQPAPKMVMSLFRKGVHKLSASRHHTAALTEEGDAYQTIIIDHAKLVPKCAFHRMKPKLHIKDIVATPVDHTILLDLNGIMYTYEPNALDDPHIDVSKKHTLLAASLAFFAHDSSSVLLFFTGHPRDSSRA